MAVDRAEVGFKQDVVAVARPLEAPVGEGGVGAGKGEGLRVQQEFIPAGFPGCTRGFPCGWFRNFCWNRSIVVRRRSISDSGGRVLPAT